MSKTSTIHVANATGLGVFITVGDERLCVVGWKPGDRLLVAPMRPLHDALDMINRTTADAVEKANAASRAFARFGDPFSAILAAVAHVDMMKHSRTVAVIDLSPLAPNVPH